MPTILELFKKSVGDQNVTVWDGTTKKPGIVGKVKDFVSAEFNPTGPRVMFYKKLITPPLIYGTETPRISLKGAVDPPRTLAVSTAKYQSTKSTTGKITIASLLGGTANRPSDTIFESNIGAPVTKGTLGGGPGDYAGLQNSVEAGKSYYVSQYPMGKSPLAGVLKGDLNTIGANVVGAGISSVKKAVGNQISKLIKKNRKINTPTASAEKPKISPTNSKYQYNKPKKFIDIHNNDSKDVEQKYTTHIRNSDGSLGERKKEELIYDNNNGSKFDQINSSILTNLAKEEELNNENLKKLYQDTAGLITAPYVLFKPYRKVGFAGDNILLPGTISGISEDVTPEWSTFKFIGSPFNQYRYIGVERTINFELKLYGTNFDEITSMKKSLNKLRKLVYPDENITAIQYAGNSNYSPIVFNGNLAKLTINGMYYDLLGFIETLSISIDDSVSWTTELDSTNISTNTGAFTKSLSSIIQTPSPSVINVSLGFKVINEIDVDASDTAKQKLRFYFDRGKPQESKPQPQS